MVASSFVDSLLSDGGSSERLRRVVAQLVQTALNDLIQIENLDDSLAPENPVRFDRRTAALLRDEYERWVGSTASLLDRIKGLGSRVGSIPDIEPLQRAYGKTRARLSISLDDMEQSLLALAEGRLVPAEDVRRDLQLRLH